MSGSRRWQNSKDRGIDMERKLIIKNEHTILIRKNDPPEKSFTITLNRPPSVIEKMPTRDLLMLFPDIMRAYSIISLAGVGVDIDGVGTFRKVHSIVVVSESDQEKLHLYRHRTRFRAPNNL